MRRPLVIIAFGVLVPLIQSVTFYVAYQQTYAAETKPIRSVINAGEQMWADEAERMLERMIHRTSDRRRLAEQLAADSDQNLVAEGMVLAVVSQHPQARQMIETHRKDAFVNWQLSTNGGLADELLKYLDRKPVDQYVMWWVGRATGAAS